MRPGYYGTSHPAYRPAPGDATPLNTQFAGRRTSTPSASTDNHKPRRPLGAPRRVSSPGRGQPSPTPSPPPPSSRPPASSSLRLAEPVSPPRAGHTGRRYPSLPSSAVAAKSSTPTLPSAAASSATNTSRAAVAAAAPDSAPPSHTLTTAYPATDAPGPDRVNRESVISILDDPFFLRYDYDPTLDPESPAFAHPPRSAADHQPGGHEKAARPRWPPPRRESLTISPSPFLVRTSAGPFFQLCALVCLVSHV